jgi:hypothetical protein
MAFDSTRVRLRYWKDSTLEMPLLAKWFRISLLCGASVHAPGSV